MKNSPKGFILPLVVIAIVVIAIAVFAIGGGVFIYQKKHQNNIHVESVAQTNATSTNMDAVASFVEKIVAEQKLTKLPLECISIMDVNTYPDTVQISGEKDYQILEKHDAQCGGDQETAPRLFNIKLNTVTREMKVYGIKGSVESEATTVIGKNWKTYSDTRNRFNIKYPADWHSLENGKQDYVVFCPSTDLQCNSNSVYVYVYSKGGTKDVLKNFRDQGPGYTEKTIVVNGKNAIQREESYCMGTPRLTNGVFIEGGNNGFQVQGPYYSCGPAEDGTEIKYNESESIFNHMISTFTFPK